MVKTIDQSTAGLQCLLLSCTQHNIAIFVNYFYQLRFIHSTDSILHSSLLVSA